MTDAVLSRSIYTRNGIINSENVGHHVNNNNLSFSYMYVRIYMYAQFVLYAQTHIYTSKVSLFDTGVGQEGIDESHIHCNTLKNLFHIAKVLSYTGRKIAHHSHTVDGVATNSEVVVMTESSF